MSDVKSAVPGGVPVMVRLKSWYLKQMFDPSIFGVFVNPFFLARRALHRGVASVAAQVHGHLLDVGCGSKPYESLFHVSHYVGVEIDSERSRAHSKADLFYDGKTLPVGSSIVDSVLCNQVLEHVFNPDQFLAEINRVLKNGGVLLLTVPFVWDEHEQPFDYARYSSFGLKALLEKNGFEIVEQKKLLDDFSLIFQLTIAYLYKITQTSNRFVNAFRTVTLFAFLSLTGWLLGKILPANPDLFLDQLVLARKIS